MDRHSEQNSCLDRRKSELSAEPSGQAQSENRLDRHSEQNEPSGQAQNEPSGQANRLDRH